MKLKSYQIDIIYTYGSWYWSGELPGGWVIYRQGPFMTEEEVIENFILMIRWVKTNEAPERCRQIR
jgi:hypothetical protein